MWFIYVYLFIYLFYLNVIHDLFNDASRSSEFTSSIESLIVEELMTREKCVKERSVVLIWGTITVFSLMGWEKWWKITVR